MDRCGDPVPVPVTVRSRRPLEAAALVGRPLPRGRAQLNPAFTWTCVEAGTGITCQVTFAQAYGPEVVEFQCDGQPVCIAGRAMSR